MERDVQPTPPQGLLCNLVDINSSGFCGSGSQEVRSGPSVALQLLFSPLHHPPPPRPGLAHLGRKAATIQPTVIDEDLQNKIERGRVAGPYRTYV